MASKLKRPETPQEAARRGNRMVEALYGDIRRDKGMAVPVAMEEPVRKVRAERKPSGDPLEKDLQKALIEWWGLYRKKHGLPSIALFAVPNGAALRGNQLERAIQMTGMKAQGFRPGVPDLVLAVPKGRYHGAYIEMKTRTGSVSPEQAEYIQFLRSQDYAVQMCRSTEIAMEFITKYLEERLQ